MATGYTACIAEGVSFNDFVLRCARAMGACITMRDESVSTPIPESFEPEDYHKNALEKAKMDLAKLYKMSKEVMQEKVAKYNYDRKVAEHSSVCRDEELKNKYDEMIEKVENWKPPTRDHVGFKNFMLEQLRESVKWDCGYSAAVVINDVSVEEWKEQQETSFIRDIEYHKNGYAEEVKRTEERNAWLSALRNSLKEGE